MDITLYERNAKVGGNIQTIIEDGFLFETGPNGFLSNNPSTLQFIEEIGLKADLIQANRGARRRYIQMKGQLVKLPISPFGFMQTPLISFLNKCLLVKGAFTKYISKDRSIYDYVSKRFNKDVAENLIDPFIKGICAGDIKRLHMDYAFPKFTKKRNGKMRMHSFKNGMGEVIDRLNELYAKNIKTNYTVKSLNEIKADRIICTIPAFAASDLLQIPVLKKIRYVPVSVVGLGFSAQAFKNIPDGFGYLIPTNQGKEILGVVLESNVYTGRAPHNMLMNWVNWESDTFKLI